MKRIVYTVLAALILAQSVFASSQSFEPAMADVSASAYVLMDSDSSKVLSASSPSLPLPMASTTKIMTCILALEEKDRRDVVVIPEEAVGVEGSSVYLTKGETLTLEELLYALMLESANDAAVAIAIYVSGSVEAFVERMNQKADEIGMHTTRFANPHGLPSEGHYSTALDMARLMQYAMNHAAFSEIVATRTFQIPAPKSGYRYLSNHNKLLRLYPDCVGGKTGFTKKAGRCLVSCARRNGKTLICVTLGAPDDWQDHMALFEYGFSLYSMHEIVGAGEITRSIPIVGGCTASALVKNSDGFQSMVADGESVSVHVEVPRFLYAKVCEGETVGQVVICIGDREVGRIPLQITQSVEAREESLSLFQKILQKFKLWLK